MTCLRYLIFVFFIHSFIISFIYSALKRCTGMVIKKGDISSGSASVVESVRGAARAGRGEKGSLIIFGHCLIIKQSVRTLQ